MTRSLPVEIIARIFEFVRDDHPPGVFYSGQFREEERTLARLARLSRTFHYEATKALLSTTAIWMCERDQSKIDTYYDKQEEYWEERYVRYRGLDSDDPDGPDGPPPKVQRPMRFQKVLKKLQDLNRNPSLLSRRVRRVYISVNTSDYEALDHILPQLKTFLQHTTTLRHIHLQTGPQSDLEVVEFLTAELAGLAFATIQSIKVYFHKGMLGSDNYEQEEETYDFIASFMCSNPSLVDVDLKGMKTWPDTYSTSIGRLPRLKRFKGSMNLMESIELGELEELWIGWEKSDRSDAWGIKVLDLTPGTRYEHLRFLSFDLSGPFARLINLFDLLRCRHDFPHLELLSGCKLVLPMPAESLYKQRQTFWTKFPELKTIVAVWSGFGTPYEGPKLHNHEIDRTFHFIMKHLFPKLEGLELVDAHHESPGDSASYSLVFQCYRYNNDPYNLPRQFDYNIDSYKRPRVVDASIEARRFAELQIAEVFGSGIMGEDVNSEHWPPFPGTMDWLRHLLDDRKRQESREKYFADRRWAMW
ncbi:hypothetical protein SISSUDRAFT_1132261 [Sistotremastrum suecicum HHB10207 ss-3]|uniref:Uncharacterized protein n=1 Tax=Sistotremastrum suecicum HHB10207 ss-3 TaxID=1314776 RepID=A0A165Z3B8_9AGAM|nr:hypothetical protein SISSUDRAFT_1132261 [Sistotremastrum suecicum HHB10207 ss-3]